VLNGDASRGVERYKKDLIGYSFAERSVNLRQSCLVSRTQNGAAQTLLFDNSAESRRRERCQIRYKKDLI
jgi:hypothetical protein